MTFGPPTRRRSLVPSVMMVGVVPELSEACKHKMVPIPVMRVGHLAAAAERIVVTRPLIAVVAESVPMSSIATFRELAAGVGCEVVMLVELGTEAQVPDNLEARVIAASRKRSGEFKAI